MGADLSYESRSELRAVASFCGGAAKVNLQSILDSTADKVLSGIDLSFDDPTGPPGQQGDPGAPTPTGSPEAQAAAPAALGLSLIHI
eukprot:8145493-Pyramimonas_sp.AAC.1